MSLSYRELEAKWKREREMKLQLLAELRNGTPLYCPGCGQPLVQRDSKKAREQGLYECENPDCWVYEVRRTSYHWDDLLIKIRWASRPLRRPQG